MDYHRQRQRKDEAIRWRMGFFHLLIMLYISYWHFLCIEVSMQTTWSKRFLVAEGFSRQVTYLIQFSISFKKSMHSFRKSHRHHHSRPCHHNHILACLCLYGEQLRLVLMVFQAYSRRPTDEPRYHYLWISAFCCPFIESTLHFFKPSAHILFF